MGPEKPMGADRCDRCYELHPGQAGVLEENLGGICQERAEAFGAEGFSGLQAVVSHNRTGAVCGVRCMGYGRRFSGLYEIGPVQGEPFRGGGVGIRVQRPSHS